MNRRRARERALQLLFQIDVGKMETEEAVANAVLAEGETAVDAFTLELVRGTRQNLDKIDATIAQYATDWSIDRMANVDRNVLRLALYELLYREDIPNSVAINEAVELVKKYSTPESGKFVNGILGRVAENTPH